MLGPAWAIRTFSLERWIGLPAPRARCVRHFLAIAATLAAAKVLLATIGVALFVAEQGAAGLPPFYVGFAAVAILLSFGLSTIIDRAPKVRLAQVTFAGLLLGTAALRLLLALELPGVSFALLASATAFEIVLDILFWVVVAAYLDAFELRRVTPLVYMALALGGAAGGALARLGAGALPPADLLFLLLPLAGLVAAQLGAVARQLHELPDTQPDAGEGAAQGLGPVRLCRLLKRYPLALLIALNALVVTLLYGLSEFLILSIYEARFTSEAELAEFLSLLFALMQIVEFGLLYTLTRALLERTGPLVRNLVFPLTSLGSLLLFVLRPKLAAAVVLHVNIEAASNALFLPIHNVNHVPLPLGLQGRTRTLSEGICYPIGLALAGAVLWTADPAALLQVEFAALVFAGLFALLSAGVGLLFLPTLGAHVGAGLRRPGRPGAVATAGPTPRVRHLLRSREPELRLLGLALAQHLDPQALQDDLLALATRPDRATRIALARLIAGVPERWPQHDLDRCLVGESVAAMKLALLVMLIRRAPLAPEQMQCVMVARDPAVLALGYLVAEGLGARAGIEPLIRSPDVAVELVDAILCTGRADLVPLLPACLETARPEQQRGALAMMNALAEPPDAAAIKVGRRLARHRDPALRAEAIALLGRARPRAAAVRALVAALDDPDARVRRRAAEALCRHGDRATALLRRPLGAVTAASVDAVWALARITSPRARRLLVDYVRQLQQDAVRTRWLLGRIAGAPDGARWSALELCLRDHQACLVDVVLAALPPAIDARLAGQVRDALRGADQRRRASAFELIAAVPASRLPPGAAALLRGLLFEDGAGARPGPDQPATVLDQATASMSPWVRRAAALIAGRSSSRDPSGDGEMKLDDRQLERIVALKRTPLFRYVPFETLVEVAKAVQARTYLAGEEVITGGTSRQDLLILEAGALVIGHHDGPGSLRAPACFGEVALAGEPMPWPRITAIEEARVSWLHATIFQELCGEHPEMALELSRLLARRLLAVGGAGAR